MDTADEPRVIFKGVNPPDDVARGVGEINCTLLDTTGGSAASGPGEGGGGGSELPPPPPPPPPQAAASRLTPSTVASRSALAFPAGRRSVWRCFPAAVVMASRWNMADDVGWFPRVVTAAKQCLPRRGGPRALCGHYVCTICTCGARSLHILYTLYTEEYSSAISAGLQPAPLTPRIGRGALCGAAFRVCAAPRTARHGWLSHPSLYTMLSQFFCASYLLQITGNLRANHGQFARKIMGEPRANFHPSRHGVAQGETAPHGLKG